MSRKRRINYFIPFGAIAAVGLAVYTSNKPWKVYQQEKAKATEMRKEMDALQLENAKLKEKVQPLNPIQKEEEARRLGYVRPDEVPIVDKTEKPDKPEEPKPEVKKHERSAPPINLRESDTNEETSTAPQ
jgi:cell division protein FtsB